MASSQSKVTIRQLQTSEWQQYRSVRLAALKDSPDAFGSTYESSVKRDDHSWITKVETYSSEFEYPLVAVFQGEFVGLAWTIIAPPDVLTAHIYQMWVRSNMRGQGVGQRMMEKAIQWAHQKGVKKVVLDVTYGDRPARRLYDRLGFVAVGDPIPLREDSDLTEQCMELHF